MSKIITDVPEGWKIQRLKRVCKLRKRTKLPPLREIANIPMALIPEDGKYATFIMKLIDDIKSGDICKEGDILLAGITPSFENGKQGIVPQLPSKYAITSTEAFPIICDPDVETHFIFHLLKYEFTRRIIASRMEGSTGRQRVPSDVLMNFHIPVPPLVEQRGIVEVLGTVDECIRLTDAVIERAEELKRGLMQQLLTRGIGHTEYKETLQGKIPKTWKIFDFGDVVKKTQLGTMKTSDSSKGVPLIKMGNLTFGGFDFTKLEYINENNTKIMKKYLLNEGDFLFNTRNTPSLVGKSAVWHNYLENAIFNNNIMRIWFSSKVIDSSDFVSYIFSSERGYNRLRKYVNQTTSVAAIYWKALKKFKIQIPPIEEQKQITNIFNTIDKKTSSASQKLTYFKALKEGLMQLLLSGKIRVELKGDELHRIGDGREANN